MKTNYHNQVVDIIELTDGLRPPYDRKILLEIAKKHPKVFVDAFHSVNSKAYIDASPKTAILNYARGGKTSKGDCIQKYIELTEVDIKEAIGVINTILSQFKNTKSNEEIILEYFENGKHTSVDCIKKYRQLTGKGLKESIKFIDFMKEHYEAE